MRFKMTDEEWELLEPTQRKSTRVDDRRILNAIAYMPRTGRLLVQTLIPRQDQSRKIQGRRRRDHPVPTGFPRRSGGLLPVNL